MEVFSFVKTLPFLLLFAIGLIASNAVNGDPLQDKMRKGASGGEVFRSNTTKEENQLKRLRRSVHDPYEACFRQFFIDKQPPTGLRKNLHNLKYICQQVADSHDVFYATMFDENLGIAVYAGYKLDQGTINFGQAGGVTGWRREPGILKQGSDAIYLRQQYDKGHLVPAQTYSSSEARLHSTYKHTNAVPQVGAFNRGQWAQFETRIRNYAQNNCVPNNGVLYLLTGTSFARVHVVNNQLQSISVQPNLLPPAQNYPSIFIPNSMWTAGCCVAPNGYVRSFAVIGNNDLNNRFTEQITLNQLQNILAADVIQFGLGGPDVNLFPGHVNCANNNLQQLPQAQGG